MQRKRAGHQYRLARTRTDFSSALFAPMIIAVTMATTGHRTSDVRWRYALDILSSILAMVLVSRTRCAWRLPYLSCSCLSILPVSRSSGSRLIHLICSLVQKLLHFHDSHELAAPSRQSLAPQASSTTTCLRHNHCGAFLTAPCIYAFAHVHDPRAHPPLIFRPSAMDFRADSAMSGNQKTMDYTLELQCIKALFNAKQYRQCINTSREALREFGHKHGEQHVLRTASLEFYMGLAHDELARLMHEHSQIKLPTFSEAEKHYQQALAALPTLEQCKRHARKIYRRREEELALERLRSLHAPESDTSNYSPTTPPVLSSPPAWFTETRERNPIAYSPATLRHESTSNVSDLSSHESFDEIMTPNRLVHRDISRMSLLDNPLPREYSSMSLIDRKPSLRRSISQGLLRPIRPGSPPKPFHLPPKMPYIGKRQSVSRIPQLPRLHITDSPTKRPHSRLVTPEDPSPVSPVSPLGSDTGSDMRSLSPVSARTPTPLPTPTPEPEDPEIDTARVEEHLQAFRARLHTHLRLVQSARLLTSIAQNKRAARSSPVTESFSIMRSSSTSRPGGKGGLAHARSFWSFKPEDVKVDERRKKIETRRAQGWKRGRFRPEKYQALAENALAEL